LLGSQLEEELTYYSVVLPSDYLIMYVITIHQRCRKCRRTTDWRHSHSTNCFLR